DIPGHYWTITGANTLTGDHYNTGPLDEASWWATGEENDILLWTVDAAIDDWTASKAEGWANKDYLHYHELVRVSDGMLHPSKVVWLKHTAVTSFNFDGGPHPEFGPREVTTGIDAQFLPNGDTPYDPDISTGVESKEIIEVFSLEKNFPNPFNPTTSIGFTLAEPGHVVLEVYNAAGQKVATLVNGFMNTGSHSAMWDASSLNSGVYFYTLRTLRFSQTGKMMLLK
ncbi:MAG: T9SS type A sorting domain-containing protein, partial [Candidatus Latescibacteria bacterium]|nr:T9SS type A sorting domain-containing protein [Candidatus Latescibacterota bacterium]